MSNAGTVEDRLAIRELLEHYADAVCLNDPELWGATWAEDGLWEMPDYPEYPPTKGRKAIVEMWKGAMANYPGIIFVATPGVIEIDGDRAKVRSYTSEVFTDSAGKVHRHRGRYEDIVVKRNGQWLFLQRSFRNIHREE